MKLNDVFVIGSMADSDGLLIIAYIVDFACTLSCLEYLWGRYDTKDIVDCIESLKSSKSRADMVNQWLHLA